MLSFCVQQSLIIAWLPTELEYKRKHAVLRTSAPESPASVFLSVAEVTLQFAHQLLEVQLKCICIARPVSLEVLTGQVSKARVTHCSKLSRPRPPGDLGWLASLPVVILLLYHYTLSLFFYNFYHQLWDLQRLSTQPHLRAWVWS